METERITYKKTDIILFALMFVLNIILISWLYRNFQVSADYSNHILQGKDLLQGNLLFSGWNLSQVTFLFSDNLFCTIGVLFAGVDRKAILIAFVIGNALTQLLFFLLCCYRRTMDRKTKLCMLLMIWPPAVGLLMINTIHYGAWIYCLIGYMLFDAFLSAEAGRKKMLGIIVTVLWTVGIFSDFLVFVCGGFPFAIYLSIEAYRTEDKRKRIEILCSNIPIFASLIIAYALEVPYFLIGGANRVGTVAGFNFVDSRMWGENIHRYISFLLDSFGGNFLGRKALLPATLLSCVNALILLCALRCFVITLVRFFKGKVTDRISVILSIMIVLNFVLYIFTTRSAEHYSTITIFALYVILSRNIDVFLKEESYHLRFDKLIIGIVLVLSVLGRVWGLYDAGKTDYINPRAELEKVLTEHELYRGYASFVNSSPITIDTNERICIRHVEENERGIAMYTWFNKTAWYQEYTNFVLIDNANGDRGDSDFFGVSEKNCIAFFGKPIAEYEVGPYLVLEYDKDLSTLLADPDKKTKHFSSYN